MANAHLNLEERIEVEAALRAGDTQAIIAVRLARSAGTISREVALNGGPGSYHAVRVAGVSEFLVVSLLCKIFGVPVVPHVGDMGQLHQHLVLFNRIAVAVEIVFLEHIPHLREHFVFPCHVTAGVYQTPLEPGASCDLKSP